MHVATVDSGRRQALSKGASLLAALFAAGFLPARLVEAAGARAAFEAAALEDALAVLGIQRPEDSPLVQITTPEVAENGAVVPVTVQSLLAGSNEILILAEKNPTPLVAHFFFAEGSEPFITTRIKMAQTSNVVALVKANGKLYRAAREVKVIAGGC